MRQTSVGATRTRQGGGARKERPDPNSKTGRLLAALMAGDWLSAKSFFGGSGNGAHAIEYLRSNYGMEIETKGGRGGGSRLLGEWDGPYFVPIERMEPYPPHDTSNALSNISR